MESAIQFAEYRKRFGPVYVMDCMNAGKEPFRNLTHVRFNNLARYFCNPSDPATFDIHASQITKGLIPAKPDARDPYWNTGTNGIAKDIVMCLAKLHTCVKGGDTLSGKSGGRRRQHTLSLSLSMRH